MNALSASPLDSSFATVLEEIASELDLRPLLTRLIARACGLLDSAQGTIGLYVPQRNVVQIEAIYRLPETELSMEFEPGEGLVGRVLLTGAPIIADRYGDLSRISLPEHAEDAVIGAPIYGAKGELIGVFGIGAPPPRRFGPADLETLQAFARHAAIAIQNALRYQREQRRTERMRLIASMARMMTAGLDAEELAATAAQTLHEHLGYPNVCVPLLVRDADGDYLLFRSHAGAYRDVFEQPFRLPVTRGVTGASVSSRRAQVVNDVRKDPRYTPPPLPINVRCELAAPIALGEEVFGCINIEGLKPFDDDDVESVQIVADYLAVAMKNIQLSHDARDAAVMRERQRLARDLHDSVSQALSSMSLIAQSLASAWRRDPAEGERRARRIEELARLAFGEMRALLRELRPESTLDSEALQAPAEGVLVVRSQGLASAVQRCANVLAPHTPCIRLNFSEYERQPARIEEPLYLICREALSNAIRHSGASRVHVYAGVRDHMLTLGVEDDGRGFEQAAQREAELGIGLHTMRERAAALGGVCEIRSEPGQGTLVCIRLPLAAQ
jgi:signal transduction histidine kinase